MKEWILSVGLTIILITVISLLLPEGRMGKFISSLFPLILLLVIIKPLLYVDFNDINVSQLQIENKIDVQNEYILKTSKRKANNYEKICENVLKNNNYENATVKIDFDIIKEKFLIKKVKINLKNAVFIDKNKHIDITKITEEISLSLLIDKSLVVYEQ